MPALEVPIVVLPTAPLLRRLQGAGLHAAGRTFRLREFGAWRRGNEPYGEFAAGSEQKHSGGYAGKLAYNIPNVDSNYVVYTRTTPLAIPDGTQVLSLWVYGDDSRAFLNAWMRDALAKCAPSRSAKSIAAGGSDDRGAGYLAALAAGTCERPG